MVKVIGTDKRNKITVVYADKIDVFLMENVRADVNRLCIECRQKGEKVFEFYCDSDVYNIMALTNFIVKEMKAKEPVLDLHQIEEGILFKRD